MIILPFLLLISNLVSSQDCPPSDVYFLFQNQIDEYAAQYPNCTEINGYLIIDGSNITNLEGLSKLKTIRKYLDIRGNPGLTNLKGLENIETISHSLIIQSSKTLKDISALSKVRVVGHTLLVRYNEALTNLEGLENIRSIGSAIEIEENPALETINGFDSLISVNYRFWIKSNPVLKDIAGFERLSFINKDFDIENNPSLEQIEGFNNLGRINGDLSISNNPNLATIDGFSKLDFIKGNLVLSGTRPLTEVNGLNQLTSAGSFTIADNDNLSSIEFLSTLTNLSRFTISGNAQLRNLVGLENLTNLGSITIKNNLALANINSIQNVSPVNLEYLVIEDCPNLTICHLENVCQYLNSQKTGLISNNGPNCETKNAVLEACSPIDCPFGDITFKTQEEVDDFILNYPNCTEINGYLRLSPKFNIPSINNLQGLKNIQTITGTLSIDGGDSLKSLIDLESIEHLGGLFLFKIAPDFSLQGLEKLDTIGTITCSFNVENSTTTTPGNPLLSFEGLENLTTIDGDLVIFYSYQLDFRQLKRLKNITGDLRFLYNIFPNDFRGLDSLESVGGDFTLGDININSLTNFSSLKSIGGKLELRDIGKLESLEGLENIDYKTIEDLQIRSGNLTFCGVKSICDYLQTGGMAEIFDNSNNKTGCKSIEEVLASCTTTSNKESLLRQSIRIYPNPVQQKLNIDFPVSLKGQYSISNHLGQLVFKGTLKRNLEHDFTDYPKGLYFITVKTENFFFTKKVIHQ